VISETKTFISNLLQVFLSFFVKLFHRLETLYQSHHLMHTRFVALEGLAWHLPSQPSIDRQDGRRAVAFR
jgi:hypothetical protein